MKVAVQLDGRDQELDVVRRRDTQGGERLTITREGQTTEVRVVYRQGPHFVLEFEEQRGDHVLRRRLRAAASSEGDARQLWVNGSNVQYERLQRGGQPAADRDAAGSVDLSASIPAVVSEILVSVGQRVSAGQKLILLESMKMIMPIQATHDGVVSAIHCQEGDAVQPGVGLVEIGK